MNPNISKGHAGLVKQIWKVESTLYKKFAWLPKHINDQYIWLQNYWVQYHFAKSIGINKSNRIINRLTEKDYMAEILKGNIKDGKLLTTPKRRAGKRCQ